MTEPISHPLAEIVFPMGEAEGSPVVIQGTPAGVVVVNINRPHRKNAFDSATIDALHEAFVTLGAQETVRAVFLRGVGGAFSAGADLDWMRDAAGFSEDQNREDARELVLLPTQRFVYSQLMYLVVWRALLRALGGVGSGWVMLKRTGGVAARPEPLAG